MPGDRHGQHAEALDRPRDAARPVLRRPAARGRGDSPQGAADARARGLDPRERSCTRAPTSSAAGRSGNRSAACSWARSGATAAMSRRTGPPTGCTAKPLRCSTSWRGASAGAPYDAAGRGAAGGARRPAAGADAREHLRPRDRHDHARRGPRRRRSRTSPRTTRACSATIRRRAHLREAYAMKNDTVPDADAPARADGLLLVDGLGRDDRAPGRRGHLHQQLAERAARRQHARRRRCASGRRSACCS